MIDLSSATMAEKHCTLVINKGKDVMPSQQEMMAELEKPDIGAKTKAIKQVLIMLLNGERMPKLLMTVIRYACCQPPHATCFLAALCSTPPRHGVACTHNYGEVQLLPVVPL